MLLPLPGKDLRRGFTFWLFETRNSNGSRLITVDIFFKSGYNEAGI